MAESHIGGVLVEIFGEEYQIATNDARQMRKLAAYVDEKMQEIEKERIQIEEDKQQVDRYKQLLLK